MKKKMQEREGVGVNLIWAITFLIAVSLIAGAIYYTGLLGAATGSQDKNIDVDVKLPSVQKSS